MFARQQKPGWVHSIRSDSSGNVLAYQGHYPFGETWHNTGSPHQWMFTSYERDSESGNDYATHRYDANRLGRFTTADPIHERMFNPQRLNRYSYVMNDPVRRTDPLGLGFTISVDIGGDGGLEGRGGVCWSVYKLEDFCGAEPGGGWTSLLDPLFSFACRGTTDCSYYDGRCSDAEDALIPYLICGELCAGDVPGMIFYYCEAAPGVCKRVADTPYRNCVRLCLQENDDCFGRISFLVCTADLHLKCFAKCLPCKLNSWESWE